MKCYFGGSKNPFDYDFVSACFANTAAEAKQIMWSKTDLSEECDGDFLNARVIRKPEFDSLIDSAMVEPYIIRDDKTLRLIGFSVDGDNWCDTCGLAEMGGLFPVCDCGQCKECGCEQQH